MKRRKTKSRMTRVDLDAVLKLQKDYCNQTYEIQRTLEAVFAMSMGFQEPVTLEFDNKELSVILSKYRDLNQLCKEQETKLKEYEHKI